MKFKPEDFIPKEKQLENLAKCGLLSPVDVARLGLLSNIVAYLANAKLQEWLDAAPNVFQSMYESDTEWSTLPSFGGKTGRENITKFIAKLVCIEEINSEFTKESERLIERVDPKDILDE